MLKIAVVANCQARPIAFLLENALTSVEVISVAIVHLLKNEQCSDYIKNFNDADFIVTQKIAETYPCQFIRTNELRKKYGHKIIEIPNLFYRGYNPELKYYRIPGQGTLTGPLGDYHNEIIFESWARGYSIEQTYRQLDDENIWSSKYSLVPQRSLEELVLRENDLDIGVSDYLIEYQAERRLFYTFNHPCLEILVELVRKLAILLSKKIKKSFRLESMPEPLNQFYIPISNHAAKIIGFELKNDSISNCRGLKKDEQGRYTIRGFYSSNELINEFFIAYDENKLLIEEKLL